MKIVLRTKLMLMGVAALLLGGERVRAGDSLPPLNDGKAPQTFEALWAGYDPRKAPLDVEELRLGYQETLTAGEGTNRVLGAPWQGAKPEFKNMRWLDRSGAVAADVVPGTPITVASLLNEMMDRRVVARLPGASYACRQASSYNRAQKTPGDPKGWFANEDWSHFVRSETRNGKTEWVMMDVEGPGAIVRLRLSKLSPASSSRAAI